MHIFCSLLDVVTRIRVAVLHHVRHQYDEAVLHLHHILREFTDIAVLVCHLGFHPAYRTVQLADLILRLDIQRLDLLDALIESFLISDILDEIIRRISQRYDRIADEVFGNADKDHGYDRRKDSYKESDDAEVMIKVTLNVRNIDLNAEKSDRVTVTVKDYLIAVEHIAVTF